MELPALVVSFADAIAAVDRRCPAYVSRSGREYQLGIGPYAENRAMELVVEELKAQGLGPLGQFLSYPDAPRQKCDLWLGQPVQWAVEVKMGRFRGDNGKPDDTSIKDLISPFRGDRSALTDASKLAASKFPSRKAILVYGFDDVDRPLADAVDALDTLLRRRTAVGPSREAVFEGLRHPVFSSGRVVAWEIFDSPTA